MKNVLVAMYALGLIALLSSHWVIALLSCAVIALVVKSGTAKTAVGVISLLFGGSVAFIGFWLFPYASPLGHLCAFAFIGAHVLLFVIEAGKGFKQAIS